MFWTLRSGHRARGVFMTLAAIFAAAGCVGQVGPSPPSHPGADPDGRSPAGASSAVGGTGAPGPSSSQGTTACAEGPGAAPTPIRLLTRREFDNAIRDLLGDESKLGQKFTAEQRFLGFDNSAFAFSITELLAEQHEAAAFAIARRAAADPAKLLGCDPVRQGEDVCVTRFLPGFARRAFRRPLNSSERERLVAFYVQAKASHGFRDGVAMAVQAVLLSPRFLYRLEVGRPVPGTGAARLDPYEVASRLGFLIWGSLPDEALLEAADSGALARPEEIQRQARRLLADPRAQDTFRSFHEQWLELQHVHDLTKDRALVPSFRPELIPLFEEESAAFVEHVMGEGTGRLTDLLRAPFTFVNDDLARFYGLPLPGSRSFTKVGTDPKQRSGILTQASIMATHASAQSSSPVARGVFIREKLLCSPPPPAPAGLEVQLPPFDPRLTTRERLAQHRADPSCAGCHRLMDDLGLGFEHYDAVGLWRDREAGRPVDARGELVGTDVDGPFTGAIELAERLDASQQVKDCVIGQWFRFGVGRGETEADRCTLDRLRQTFAATGGDARALILSLVVTDAFLYRSVDPS